MALLCCKIIGDGKSPETAFRTVIQQYSGLRISNEAIPVDPKTGFPVQAFALLDVHDDDIALLAGETKYVALPKSGQAFDKNALVTALAAQSCNVDLTGATTADSVVTKLLTAVEDAKAIKP